MSPGLVKPLPTVTGPDLSLRIAHQMMTMDGKRSHAIGINGTVLSKMGMKGPFAKAEMDMPMKMMSAKGTDAAETYNRKITERRRGALANSEARLRSSMRQIVVPRKSASEYPTISARATPRSSTAWHSKVMCRSQT